MASQQPIFCRADLNYVGLSFAGPFVVNVSIRDGRWSSPGRRQDSILYAARNRLHCILT
jgi:hypothetical protein